MKKTIMLLITFVIASSAFAQNGWTDVGTVVRLNTNTDKVGIGTLNPLSQLSVGGNGNNVTAIFGRTNKSVAIRGVAFNTGIIENYGGYFEAKGKTGRGVFGIASYTDYGPNYGGYFEAKGNKGRGVYGVASKTDGRWGWGGYFEAHSKQGVGVYAIATNTYINTEPEQNYGGFFEVEGRWGIGVKGLGKEESACGVYGVSEYTNNVGKAYGVRGKCTALQGWAGYFEGRGYFSGNVGIGTDNPWEALDVHGNIRLSSDVNSGQRNIIGPKFHTLGIFARPNEPHEGMAFSTDNGVTTEMFIRKGGNIGIGTNSPGSKLSIVGLIEYTNNATAKTAGLVAGDLYRTGDLLKIVH